VTGFGENDPTLEIKISFISPRSTMYTRDDFASLDNVTPLFVNQLLKAGNEIYYIVDVMSVSGAKIKFDLIHIGTSTNVVNYGVDFFVLGSTITYTPIEL
jgi:hypothetical protein